MTDSIKDRLAKLARALSYDEEARSTCEDAIKEIERLSGSPTPATQPGYLRYPGLQTVYIISGGTPDPKPYYPPPPSRRTQVKYDTLNALFDEACDLFERGFNGDDAARLQHGVKAAEYKRLMLEPDSYWEALSPPPPTQNTQRERIMAYGELIGTGYSTEPLRIVWTAKDGDAHEFLAWRD